MTINLSELNTPCLLLDQSRLTANLKRMTSVAENCAVILRPHLKTSKCLEIAKLTIEACGNQATVSTLKEAEIFGRAGITDLLYCVATTPNKLPRVAALRQEGIDLKIVVDSVFMAKKIAEYSKQADEKIPVLIELDLQGHRSGVYYEDEEKLVAIGRALENGAHLFGVMAHAGESYSLCDPEAIKACAINEALAANTAANYLKQNGLPCDYITIGSTPTSLAYDRSMNVSEIRAGVFLFFDLVQAGIGICTPDDIALSVLTTVISEKPEYNLLITDSGWMSLSRDRGTSKQKTDYYYGQVCREDGTVLPDILVLNTQQEHGIVGVRPGSNAKMPKIGIGERLRILPNHACATASRHNSYHVINQSNHVSTTWSRFNGW